MKTTAPTHQELTTEERLARIETLLERILDLSDERAKPSTLKVLYDVDDLKAEGIREREAYSILRRYCKKTAGRRLRITHEQLMDYYATRPQPN